MTPMHISSAWVSALNKLTSDLSCLFSALNPNWKVAYMEEEWDKVFYDAGRRQLVKVVR